MATTHKTKEQAIKSFNDQPWWHGRKVVVYQLSDSYPHRPQRLRWVGCAVGAAWDITDQQNGRSVPGTRHEFVPGPTR